MYGINCINLSVWHSYSITYTSVGLQIVHIVNAATELCKSIVMVLIVGENPVFVSYLIALAGVSYLDI